ncbi:MAG: BatA and WFA domain-containing protein [Chthoniobacteraceae bacterium]
MFCLLAMIFFQPWAAWFLAGIPIIVLLYLLKLKRRPASVSTLMFWQRIMHESRRRALFQRLRNFLSLLLHLLIFGLIVAALARPTLDRLVREGASVVVVLDARARMQTVEPEGLTRFDRARDRAAALVREASAGREIALITAAHTASVASPFSGDEKLLQKALDDLRPSDTSGDLERAVALAHDVLASRKGDRRIFVLTDRPQPARTSSDGIETRFISVGTPRNNVAITRFATRPLPNSPQTSEVLLELANFGSEKTQGNLELRYDERLLDVKPFQLEPGARQLEVFPSVPRPSRTARGWLTAKLDTADALPLDNVAFAVLPPPKIARVLLVTAGNFFLEKLLAADATVSFELITPDAWQPSLAGKFDVVIADNFLPDGFALEQVRGGILFIGKTPFNQPDVPAIERPIVTEMDHQNPLLRLVKLENITFLRAADLAPPNDPAWHFETPLQSFEHPLILTGERRQPAVPLARVAAFGFALTDSDLPLRIAFPLLISNTLHWLAGEAAEAPPSLLAGEAIELADDTRVAPRPAGEKSEPSETVGGFFQPLRKGFYQRTQAGRADWIAVNTFNDAESDLRWPPKDAANPEAVTLRTVSLASITAWPFWRYLALFAFALLAVEWSLFHRRRTE